MIISTTSFLRPAGVCLLVSTYASSASASAQTNVQYLFGINFIYASGFNGTSGYSMREFALKASKGALHQKSVGWGKVAGGCTLSLTPLDSPRNSHWKMEIAKGTEFRFASEVRRIALPNGALAAEVNVRSHVKNAYGDQDIAAQIDLKDVGSLGKVDSWKRISFVINDVGTQFSHPNGNRISGLKVEHWQSGNLLWKKTSVLSCD